MRTYSVVSPGRHLAAWAGRTTVARAQALPDPAGHRQRVMLPALAAGLLAVSLWFAASPAEAGKHDAAGPAADIVDTAVQAGSFDTLAAALQAAGLVDTLKGEGPFTVFAPTDAAFAKLPEGTIETLLQPENVDQLRAVLTYHVVPGALDHVAVANAGSLGTVNGSDVSITLDGTRVFVNDAEVVQVDVRATNGVIHVIDTVILPPTAD